MKAAIILVLLTVSALAQAPSPRERGIVQACRFDIHLWCADARLRQECLVARWTKLAGPCQDALVMPIHEGEGAKDQLGTPPKN